MSKHGKEWSVSGIDEIRDLLKNKTAKQVTNLSRSTVHSVANVAKDEMKNKVKDHKDSGLLSKSIKTKRRRAKPNKPQSDVIIADSKKGPFYWHMLENGTSTNNVQPLHYIRDTKHKMDSEAPNIMQEQFLLVLAKSLRSALKKIEKQNKKDG